MTRLVVRRLSRARAWAWMTLVLAVLLAGIRLWPREHPAAQVSFSITVWSADGRLMRITRSADDQFRVWVPLGQMSPSLVDVFLLKEDRSFYWNPGFNPTSLMRAALRTYRGGVRQGGSTITMQLARLMYHLNTRTPAGKLRQIAAALWLEARYSKSSILEAYLNLVPLGGNIQGVGAASQIYFEKSPGALTLGESLTFAVIPQRPARRSGFAASEPDLLRARTDLARRWLSRHGNSPDDARRVDLAILAHPQPMPRIAPHFVDGLLARGAGTDHRITTTIDSGLQRLVERQIHAYIEQYGDRGIRNAASLLVDTRDMSVKAWVGSADFGNDAIDGQVNGVLAKRSPGSTLKPFVYALALDQGILHPKTILRDLPTAFGPFTPENFDGRFFGPITAEAALIRSRNIPAVWVSSQLRQPTLYQFLQSAGVRDMKPESFYGLALPLGGGEITMEELAGLYAMLANQGMFRPLRLEHSTKSTAGLSLLSPEASFITFDMLRHNPRPDEDGSTPLRGRWPVAWKTGTSWGFRDAWSAGVVGPYVLVLWIGDFHGDGNPAFVGVDAAAPLFFRIADALNLARPDEAVPPLTPPPGVAKVPVCAASGELPNAYCPQVVDSWYIPGKSPIHVSQLHRVVALDRISGKPVCPPYPADTRFEVFEFWPSDMLKLFRQAGLPHRIPPPLPACTNTDPTDVPRIASPMRNVSYTIRHSARGEDIALDAQAAADVRTLFWFDGNALIGMRPVSDGALPWRPPNSGAHLIRVVDDHGRSAERDVDVRIQP